MRIQEKKKVQKKDLNKIDDDEKKILEFKKLIQNGKFNNKLNKNILEFLINKNNEEIHFYQKINNEIQDIKNKNNFKNMNI